MPLSDYMPKSPYDYQNEAESLRSQQNLVQAKVNSEQDDQANKRRTMALSILGSIEGSPEADRLYTTLKPMAERYDPTLKLPDQYDPMLTKALAGSQIDAKTRMMQQLEQEKMKESMSYKNDMLDLRREQASANQIAGAEKATEKAKAAAERGAQAYSQRIDQAGISQLLPAVNNTIDKLAPYTQPGADVPGFGNAAGMLPDFMISQEGKDLRQAYSGVRNAILKARSGGAVTDGEASRLLQELGEGTMMPDEQVVKGMANVSSFLRDRIANFQAGFSPDAIDTYRERGGTVTADSVRNVGKPSALTIGAVEDGYVYVGGDPSAPTSWKKR